MELKKGMYVRTRCGIAKIIEIEFIKELFGKEIQSIEVYYVDRCFQPIDETKCFKEDIIGKPSFNLIDLIEVGDYVNNQIVYQVGYNFQDDFVLKMSESNYEDFIYPNEIETIVTKEQMASMEYKVGD